MRESPGKLGGIQSSQTVKKWAYNLLIPRHSAEILATSFCTRENCAEKYLHKPIVSLTDLTKQNEKLHLVPDSSNCYADA